MKLITSLQLDAVLWDSQLKLVSLGQWQKNRFQSLSVC
jgi:hypothetical protein